jgi:hypothetical protein
MSMLLAGEKNWHHENRDSNKNRSVTIPFQQALALW